MCTPGQLNQVFVKLPINAAQVIETKGQIWVKTTSDKEQITISIKDRVRNTGLGLSIAYDITKKYNGEIRVESEVGKETTFTRTLPIVKG